MFNTEKIRLLKDKRHLLLWCITHATDMINQLHYIDQLQVIDEELLRLLPVVP